MGVEYRVGDLFDTDLPGIGHGCNCMGSMGAGIAVQFRRRWPDMFQQYRSRCREGRFGLGDVFVWPADDRTVFNLGTQDRIGPHAELWAVEAAVQKAVAWAEQHALGGIALPRIGAGLGGLAWPDVAATIESIAESSDVLIAVYELESH